MTKKFNLLISEDWSYLDHDTKCNLLRYSICYTHSFGILFQSTLVHICSYKMSCHHLDHIHHWYKGWKHKAELETNISTRLAVIVIQQVLITSARIKPTSNRSIKPIIFETIVDKELYAFTLTIEHRGGPLLFFPTNPSGWSLVMIISPNVLPNTHKSWCWFINFYS